MAELDSATLKVKERDEELKAMAAALEDKELSQQRRFEQQNTELKHRMDAVRLRCTPFTSFVFHRLRPISMFSSAFLFQCNSQSWNLTSKGGVLSLPRGWQG